MSNPYEKFKSYSQDEINEAFVDACASGDFDKAKYLLKEQSLQYNADIYYEDTACFKLAFHSGHVDIVKYLSCSTELKEHIDVKPYSYNILNYARKAKDWEWLEFLFPIILNDPNDNRQLKNLVSFSCRDGDFDTVNYLFNSSKWNQKIEINNELYNDACYGGNVDIIRFLREDFIKKLNINHDIAFQHCYNGLSSTDDLSVIKYLIFDLNIPYSNSIKEYIADDEQYFAQEIKKMFAIRELKNSLKSDLENKDANKSRKNKL
jgi:hypothetical protein